MNLAKHGRANTKRLFCKRVDCKSWAAEKLLKPQTASNWGINPLCTYIVVCPCRNWPHYMQELTVALSLRWLMAWTWSPLDSSWGQQNPQKIRDISSTFLPRVAWTSGTQENTIEDLCNIYIYDMIIHIYIYMCLCTRYLCICWLDYVLWFPYVSFLVLGSRQRSSSPPKTGA